MWQLVVGALVTVYVLVFGMSLHSVHEGYVGVYWRGGALLPTVTKPGLHAQVPVITTFSEVQSFCTFIFVTSLECCALGPCRSHRHHLVNYQLTVPRVIAARNKPITMSTPPPWHRGHRFR